MRMQTAAGVKPPRCGAECLAGDVATTRCRHERAGHRHGHDCYRPSSDEAEPLPLIQVLLPHLRVRPMPVDRLADYRLRVCLAWMLPDRQKVISGRLDLG